MDKFGQYSEKVIDMLMLYGPKLILAILTLGIGLWIIKIVNRIITKIFEKNNVEITLRSFLQSLIGIILKALLLISVASMIGIETTSFIAVLGAAGLAIGLALQGSLANFAGGVLILFFKPFKAGDLIEAEGYLGVVYEIHIFVTILKTLDNERIIIPNGVLSNGIIKNVFIEETRRVDLTFGISYDDDIKQAKSVIKGLLDKDSRILVGEGQEKEIYVSEHADSSVNLLVRVWVNTAEYWPVHFFLLENVKLAFDKEGITIPYPQQDVYMHPVAK